MSMGSCALQFVEGQLIGGQDAYADDYEDSPYCGGGVFGNGDVSGQGLNVE